MAGPLGRAMVATPRLLKAAYLADGEALLRETRATALFYFPGPVVLLFVLGLLDYGSYSGRHANLPAFPGLTAAFQKVDTFNANASLYLLLFFVFLTLVTLLWLLVRYLRWISTVYGITTQRVIIQSGIVGRDFDEIPMLQIRGVDVEQTAGQRVLGYGTIWVSSEGGRDKTGHEKWKGIPKPFEVQRIIQSASTNLAQRNMAGFR